MEIEETFIPAYQAIKDQLVHLASIAVSDPDQWEFPGGEEYYNYLLAAYTQTNLTADEIHEMGLAEVEKLQNEIRSMAVDLGMPADFTMAELGDRILEELPVVTGQDLLQDYEQLLAAADQAAENYFGLRASADVEIFPDPEGPPAFYQPPAPGSSAPGQMVVNLNYSPLYVNYSEQTLVHHETIPGHHTQSALAQELDLPNMQRFYFVDQYLKVWDFLGYVEGWALYAETLASEMGLYANAPWADLARLRLKMIRMVRIVADTGMHAKGWSLDDAAQYLEKMTGIPQSNNMMARYLVDPAYPATYTLGMMKITELRQRAMDALGDGFDIKTFHTEILGHGVLPINVLEQIIDDWIAGQTDS